MNNKIIAGVIVIVVIAIGVFVFLNFRAEPAELTEQKTSEVRPFTIAMNEWEPHAYLDEEGVARGIAVEIVDRVFSELGVDYEMHFVPWTRVIKGVETGDADASLSTSYSLERSEFLYYPDEAKNYVEGPFPPAIVTVSDTVFFVRKQGGDSAVKFNTPEEIVEYGYRVGVISGFYSATKI